MSELSEAISSEDASYLKLLKTLKNSPDPEAGIGVVTQLATWSPSAQVLSYICRTGRWYGRWEMKEALLNNEDCPDPYKTALGKCIAIFDLMYELDRLGRSGSLANYEREAIQSNINYLFKGLPDGDKQAVKDRAYALSATRQHLEAEAPTVGLPPPSKGFYTLAPGRKEAIDPNQPPVVSPEEDTQKFRRADLAQWAEGGPAEHETLAEEGRRATTSPDPGSGVTEQFDGSATVPPPAQGEEWAESTLPPIPAGTLDLSDPATEINTVLNLARKGDRQTVQEVANHKKWFAMEPVKVAILHNPQTPAPVQLEILNHTRNLYDLLEVVRSSRIRAMEVKTKARQRLVQIYKALSPQERVRMIQASQGRMLRELWTDAFHDEETILRLVEDDSTTSGVVLRIVRSRLAPMRVLRRVAEHTRWNKRPDIIQELVQNPKTPRDVVAEVAKRLPPAQRRRLGLAESVNG